MKRKFPQAIAKAIMRHNKTITDTWVIVLVGVTRPMMTELEPQLLGTTGVIGISDTQRTEKNGRWNVLVTEHAFKTVRKLFTAQLHKWIHELSTTALSTVPPGFNPPQLYQKYNYDDDSSAGQDSYMSSCAQSYGSFDETVTDETHFQPPGQHSSYAAALAGSDPRTGPILDTNIIVSHKPAISLTQDDVTIAQLQAEVKSLRTQLLGAHTPSTVTESSALDNVDTTDRMAKIESNMALLTSQFTMWMTEVRQNMAPPPEPDQGTKQHSPVQSPSTQDRNDPPSHDSKRTDTRKTPERLDRMEVELFSGDGSPLKEDSVMTQPREDSKRPRSPSPVHSPTSMTSLLASLARASPQYPEGYDTDSPMYVYRDNGNGSLFCIGLAQPSDFDENGTIRGPQPTEDQSERLRLLLSPPDLTDPSNAPSPRSLSPELTLATQEETVDLSPPSSPLGAPSPEPLEPTQGMEPPPSLPAEGARTENE
jgi:hypothetical protein